MTSLGLDRLAGRMREISEGINKAVDKTRKQAAEQVLFNLVTSTPIDVGTARSNWTVGVGGGAVGTRRRAYSAYPSRWRPKGRFPGGSFGERANAFAAINVGKARIRASKPDESIYIGNALPYIGRLNEGHSKQARPGWVNRAIARARETIAQKAVENLKRELR